MVNAQTAHARLDEAVVIANDFLSREAQLVSALMRLDEDRADRTLDYRSLRALAIARLRLSEEVADNLIAIGRKSVEVPVLLSEIRAGHVSVSNARTLLPILTPENERKWLSAAGSMSKRHLQKEIAREFPRQAPVEESLRYVSAERMQLKCGASEELGDWIRRVQDLESSKQKKPVNIEGALEAAVGVYLERHDPLEKARRAEERRIQKGVPAAGKAVPPANPHFIPAALEHAVNLRDGAQCTAILSDGERCPERRWLHSHHVVPVYQGGETTLENLTTLCAACHRRIHRLDLVQFQQEH